MAYLSCGFDGMPCLNYFENLNDGVFCDGMEWISGIIWITNVTWLAYYIGRNGGRSKTKPVFGEIGIFWNLLESMESMESIGIY